MPVRHVLSVLPDRAFHFVPGLESPPFDFDEFLRMQPPVLLSVFLSKEACFQHAAFPIQAFHS